jgi:arylsulfatase A-like enzyme
MVELDWVVGEVVAELRRRGQLDNTLLIFTADNGPVLDDGYQDQAVKRLGEHRPAGPFRGGKYSRFEGGTRVPWLVHWPAKIAPGLSDALVSQVDLFASLAAIAGAAKPADGVALDSLDMSRAMTGIDAKGRDYVVQHSGLQDTLAVRRGDWKYVEPARGPAVLRDTNSETANLPQPQLFNLAEDAGERANLAHAHPELVRELSEILQVEKGRR